MSFDPTTPPSSDPYLAAGVPASSSPERYPQSYVQPTVAPVEVRAQTQAPVQPVGAPPVKARGSLFGWAIAGFIVVGLAILAVLAYLLIFLGAELTLVSGILALIPLTAVLLGVLWIDRWEPEPRGLLIFGFLWGAGVSVVIALVVDLGVQLSLLSSGDADPAAVDVLGAVLQAPLVEESAKGLGVLLIFLVARRYFDGPVDGVVYAAVVAGGFAFTENVLYFANTVYAAGIFSVDTVFIFVVRGIMSPFAHVMFTAVTGLLLGFGARKGFGTAIGFFFLGLAGAISLHALWNGSTYLFGIADGSWFVFYLLVQVPLFVGAIILVVQLRKREAVLTQQRLAEYAAVGWISPAEVQSLATPAGRRQAIAWANSHGLGPLMKRYIRDATALAFVRQRIITGRDRIGAQRDEQELLGKVTAARQALQAGVTRAA